MSNAETYRDWQARTEEARKILSNKQLKLWQKAHMAAGAYAGLTLSDLRSKHRHKFLNRVVSLNRILARYELDSFDDYQQIESADLRKMVDIIKTMACPRK